MENLDLIRSQIHDSCRLALPEGLKDLMWDISREVLRAQPQNFCAFIADYLSVLLVARENLTVASHICDDVCDNICHALLEDELKMIGFPDCVALEAKNVIQRCIDTDEVNEAKIMMELLKLAEIEENKLVDIQNAIRTAFLRHQANRTPFYESSCSDSDDDVTRAARHTLRLYRQTRPTEEELNKAAVTVQAAYRAYGVRRKPDKEKTVTSNFAGTSSKKPKSKYISFKNDELCCSTSAAVSYAESDADDVSEKTDDIYACLPYKQFIHTASSMSLAGSYLKLPKYRPYSAHDPEVLHELEELAERENANVDYTLELDKLDKPRRKISFHESPHQIIEIVADVADYGSEESVEEMIECDEADGEEVSGERAAISNKLGEDDGHIEETINFVEERGNFDEELDDRKLYKKDSVHAMESDRTDESVEVTYMRVESADHNDRTYKMGEETHAIENNVNVIEETNNFAYKEKEQCGDDAYPETTVKHVNSTQDGNKETSNIIEDDDNEIIEMIHEMDNILEDFDDDSN